MSNFGMSILRNFKVLAFIETSYLANKIEKKIILTLFIDQFEAKLI